MRWLLNAYCVFAGAVIIAMVARHAYHTTDNPVDGALVGAIMSLVAFGGMIAHAVAARLWHQGKLLTAFLVTAVGVVAVLANFSNSHGALVGRNTEKQASQLRTAEVLRSDKATLARKETERARLNFVPTSDGAVSAATKAAEAANARRLVECGQNNERRGPNCQRREIEERDALEGVTKATAAKAQTDIALALDADIAALRRKIEATQPVLATNAQGHALAAMFGLPETQADWFASWQNFLQGMVVEVLVIIFLLANEAMRPSPSLMAPQPSHSSVARDSEPMPDLEQRVEVITPEPVSTPPPPRLVSSQRLVSVSMILDEVLTKDRNGRVYIADILQAYKQICADQGQTPVDAKKFAADLNAFCRRRKIEALMDGRRPYLANVKMNAAA